MTMEPYLFTRDLDVGYGGKALLQEQKIRDGHFVIFVLAKIKTGIKRFINII